jgi:4-hydroxybenzoate polyprenyltransferase
MARASKRKASSTRKKGQVKAGPIRKFRAWMDLGRAQGISTTASIAIIGALTSTAPVRFFDLASPSSFDLVDIIGMTIISIFAHTVPNCYIELGDLPLDSRIKESSMKPVVSGVLTKNEVKWFVRCGLIASWISCFIFFPSIVAMTFLALSALWVMWYGNGLGKRIAGSYDYAFSFAYSFFTLFGVFAVGEPTIYTWFFIGIAITGGTAFAQWENGLKDVDADRAAGVRSFAVLSGVKAKKGLSPGHPYMIYGYAIKIAMLLFCFLALFEMYNTEVMLEGPAVELLGLDGIMPIAYPYLMFLVLIGIGTQVFLMRRFLKHRTRLGIRKTILMDVPMSALVGFSVIIGMVNFMTLFLVIVFLIGGYFVGSALQYGTEFKFGRYAKEYDDRMERELKAIKKAKAKK